MSRRSTRVSVFRQLLASHALLLAFSLTLAACGGGGGSGGDSGPTTPPPTQPTQPAEPWPFDASEVNSGGATTINRSDVDAFGQSAPAVTSDISDQDAIFKQGNFLFRNTHANLGPLLNNGTCQGCHLKDGRGNPPPNATTPMTSMFLRISLGNDADEQPIPDPVYGTQLETYAQSATTNELVLADPSHTTEAITGEAFAYIVYETVSGSYDDGTPYELRKPVYHIRDAAYGDFTSGVHFSPRVAPGMIGLGLLEAIPEADIRARADENDADGDGISGRVNENIDITTGTKRLGRFGWKASTPSILMQTASAYRGDMGLTNSFASADPCTATEADCVTRAQSEPVTPNVSDLEMAQVEFYGRTLAVPQRRGYNATTKAWSDDIWAGRTQFIALDCVGCHVPKQVTGSASASVLGKASLFSLTPSTAPISAISNQTIWPFTDLLLHDMGGSCDPVVRETAAGASCSSGSDCEWVLRCEGLADGRDDAQASGTEWRTPPLWGTGLAQSINPAAGFLHDGRARNFAEAILWHNGEAASAQQKFRALSAAQRDQLLAFLMSL